MTVSFMKCNPSGIEIRIIWASLCNTKASESLDPYIAKPSTTILFTVQDEWVLIFYEKGFQLPAPSQVLSNDRKCKYIFMFPNKKQGLLRSMHYLCYHWTVSNTVLFWIIQQWHLTIPHSRTFHNQHLHYRLVNHPNVSLYMYIYKCGHHCACRYSGTVRCLDIGSHSDDYKIRHDFIQIYFSYFETEYILF